MRQEDLPATSLSARRPNLARLRKEDRNEHNQRAKASRSEDKCKRVDLKIREVVKRKERRQILLHGGLGRRALEEEVILAALERCDLRALAAVTNPARRG